jgi:hypothetical protein
LRYWAVDDDVAGAAALVVDSCDALVVLDGNSELEGAEGVALALVGMLGRVTDAELSCEGGRLASFVISTSASFSVGRDASDWAGDWLTWMTLVTVDVETVGVWVVVGLTASAGLLGEWVRSLTANVPKKPTQKATDIHVRTLAARSAFSSIQPASVPRTDPSSTIAERVAVTTVLTDFMNLFASKTACTEDLRINYIIA